MSTILQETFNNNVSLGFPKPIIYVDSINPSSYTSEMYNIAVRYIRSKKNADGVIIVRQSHMANDENDIYYNKQYGYWIVADEEKRTLTLYEKCQPTGLFYKCNVNRIFTLTCCECPRIVPQVFKKTNLYDDFSNELKESVRKYRNRHDHLSS